MIEVGTDMNLSSSGAFSITGLTADDNLASLSIEVPNGSTLLLVQATSVHALMVFLTGSPVSLAIDTTIGSIMAMALTGEAKVEKIILISMDANKTFLLPFDPEPSFSTTHFFRSSKNVV